MGKCRNHPEVETPYGCMKHKYFVCADCIACHDPEIYCKYRSSCAIFFLEKEKRKEKEAEDPSSK